MSTTRRKRVRVNKPTTHQQLLSKMFNLSHREIQSSIIPKAKKLIAEGMKNEKGRPIDFDMACLTVCRTNKFFSDAR